MDNERHRRDMKEIGRQIGLFRGASMSEIYMAVARRAQEAVGLKPSGRPKNIALVILHPKNDN